jgi:Na+/proline symporter
MVCAKDLIIAFCLAPVLSRLLVHRHILSPGDIMQHYYGTGARVITGIAGLALCIGGVGAQIFAIQYACQHFLALPGPIGLLVGLAVVVAYTAWGGVRAVVLTDVYQAILVFGLLPCFALGALKLIGGFGPLLQHLPPSLLSLPTDSAVNWRFASMSIALVIPFLGPDIFQRCLMASGERQIRSAFTATAALSAVLFISVGICGLVAFALIPDCQPGKAFFGLTDLLFSPGTRSVACLALLAAVMSTADSCLNAASVTIVQDLIKPFTKRPLSDAQQLRYARWATLAVGLLGVVQVLRFRHILDLVVASFDCWGSTVLVPLYAGLFGLQGSRKTFFGAVAAGQGMYWLWVFYLGQYSPLGSFIPSLLANALAFYLGWLRDGSPRAPLTPAQPSRAPATLTTSPRKGGAL